MALDENQLAVLRSWVGEVVEDSVLEERYERLGNLDSVVLETLRARRAVLVNDEPSVLTADGLTINQTENMRMLSQQEDEFVAAGGTGLETEEASAEVLGSDTYAITRQDRAR